jgi:hypothetical protein
MTSVSYGREEPGQLICYIIGLRKDIRTKMASNYETTFTL